MNLDELISGRNGAKGLDEIRYGGRVIWPPSYAFRFEVTAVRVSYPDGASQIPASGGTATIRGDVAVTQMGMVIKRYTDVPLHVTVVEGGAAFSAGSAVGTVVAEHRGTVVGPRRSCAVSLTYSVPVESGTSEVIPCPATLWQEANAVVSRDISVSITTEPQYSYLACTESEVSFTVSVTRNTREKFTSGATGDPVRDNSGEVYVRQGDAVLAQHIRNGERVTVSVGKNIHTLEARDVTLTIVPYDAPAYTHSFYVYQEADSIVSRETQVGEPVFMAGVGTGTVSARGGEVTYYVVSGYDVRVSELWASDGTLIAQTGKWHSNGWLIEGVDNDYFHAREEITQSGTDYLHITHDNMGTRLATDVLYLTIRNAADTSEALHFELRATNNRTVSEAAHEETIGLQLSTDAGFVPAGGGTVNLVCVEVYDEVADSYVYDSGATQRGASNTKWREIAIDNVTISPATGITRSGSTLYVGSNAKNASARSWTVTTSMLGFEASTTINQYADTYTDIQSDYDFWANLTTGGSSISAAGGSCVLYPSAGHTRSVTRRWSVGGDELISVAPVSDGYSLTKTYDNNGRFGLSGTTATHSGMGASVTTDTATYTCANSAYPAATRSVSFSATNAVTGTSSSKVYDSLGLGWDANPSSFSSNGGTITVSFVKTYHTTTTTTYTSGHQATSTVNGQTETGSSGITASSNASSWLTCSVPYVYVSANTGADRSGTVTFTISGTSVNANLTVSQVGVLKVTSFDLTANSTGLVVSNIKFNKTSNYFFLKFSVGGSYVSAVMKEFDLSSFSSTNVPTQTFTWSQLGQSYSAGKTFYASVIAQTRETANGNWVDGYSVTKGLNT